MQVVNVATFWSYNETVESPFEVEAPKVGRVLTFLEQKPYVSPPPPPPPSSRNPHTPMFIPPFSHTTLRLLMTTVVDSKTRIPTVKDTRFVTGTGDVIQNDGSCALTKESRLEASVAAQVQGTHRLRWHQSSPTRHHRQFPILHCKVPQPYLLLA